VLEPVAYTQDDGLRSIEGQNAGYPSGWLDANGNIWFATVRGLVRVRPGPERTLPPPAIVVDPPRNDGENHVVRYAALRLGSPERVQFRYRIGNNAAWIFAGAERTLRFSNLPAGEHRLSIAARQAGQPWSDPVQVSLVQKPRLHETWWFRCLIAAAAGALIYAVYRWRMALVQMRYRAVLSERNRIAREWHDTLLAGLSAISWQLDATLDRLREKSETAPEAVEIARTMVQHCRAEARHVIWDLRSEEPELASLASSVRSSMAEIVRGHDIQYSVGVEGDPEPLTGDLAQNVLRICQEAANNAIRHGAAKRIDVLLRFAPHRLVAAVADNGCGFAPESVPAGHFGLEIMKERASRFGGSLTVSSRQGAGTTVTAEIPL
jgi:signal transduction histidine kinase